MFLASHRSDSRMEKTPNVDNSLGNKTDTSFFPYKLRDMLNKLQCGECARVCERERMLCKRLKICQTLM